MNFELIAVQSSAVHLATPGSGWSSDAGAAQQGSEIGATLRAVKCGFNNLGFNNLGFNNPWIQRYHDQQLLDSTILGFNDLEFKYPMIQQLWIQQS